MKYLKRTGSITVRDSKSTVTLILKYQKPFDSTFHDEVTGHLTYKMKTEVMHCHDRKEESRLVKTDVMD